MAETATSSALVIGGRYLASPAALRARPDGPLDALDTQSGRAAQVRIVFANLVRNAYEAMAAGGTLTVRAAADDGHVDVAVADTGEGIKPEDQQKLFKAFAQLGDGHIGGTGLGLHLSQKLAELLKGSIEFTSEWGKGSTFILSLPRS